MSEHFFGSQNFILSQQKVTAKCPSNIALIKYWGKYANQIPANPSISYTLTRCFTSTELSFLPYETFDVKTFLSGKEEVKFAERIKKYFIDIERYIPWILKGRFEIHTENSFPHSSGIASSASGFGAIAKGVMKLNEIFNSEKADAQKSSFLARLGSGSACRSLYDGLVVWGKTPDIEGSSDLYAIPYPSGEVHSIFKNFNDWVLLIHEGEKRVSSSEGHRLMIEHPYAEARFREAKNQFLPLKEILKSGDLSSFMTLVEHEALTLHSMMMMSKPAFILMKAPTLEAIQKIWEFRRDTDLPLFFTLDAGANIHLLFPDGEENKRIKHFIESQLLTYTQNKRLVKDFVKF